MDLTILNELKHELTQLKYELAGVESRIRRDLLEKNMGWLERTNRAMQIIAAMISESVPRRTSQSDGSMPESGELPIPALHGRPIDINEYQAHAPEKVELLGGYLFQGPESRRGALALLLVNMGLLEVVQLAPADRWREALERTAR